MTQSNQIQDRAAAVLGEVLQIPVAPGENPERKQTANWDSLKHLELILYLEEEFKVRFSADQVANIHSLADIVRMVEEMK